MREYTLEDYNRVINLRKKSLGSLKISKKLGFSRGTVESWINCGRKPYRFSEKRIQACNSKENVKRLRKLSKRSQPLAMEKTREIDTKPLKNKRIDKNFAYILGVVLGDGHITKRRIILSAVDKDFVKSFKNSLEEWSGYKTKFYQRSIKPSGKIKKRMPKWVCYLDAIKIVNFIKNFKVRNLEKQKQKIYFLKGFLDSEATFSKDCELVVYNTNLEKLELVNEFLKILNLRNRINEDTIRNIKGNQIFYYYLKVLREARYLFYQKIGFNISRKQKRLRERVEKTAVDKYEKFNIN